MHKVFVIIYILLLVGRAFGAQESPDNGKDQSACVGDQRTVLSIIWSCLATIFACTWLAVHPNVPGRHITSKGTISCAIERTKIMAITILAPEIIVWAAEQFFVAWKLCHGKYDSIASVNNLATGKTGKSNLTLAHGFLSMGGLYYTRQKKIRQKPAPKPLSSVLPCSVGDYLLDDDRFQDPQLPPHYTPISEIIRIPGTLVNLDALESKSRLVRKLAAISPETIEDRSKGDALSKTISILQLSWFIVQCIARALQHLPITLLEMSTLAFTGLSILMYSLWWYKPFNVKYQISLDGSEWPDTNDPKESTFPVPCSWTERAQNIFFWVSDWIESTTLGLAVDEFCGHEFYRFYSGTSEEVTK
ncbi:hypothetical protein EDD18DRAFT_194519 [Armillaria luteobubalina]|uniref:Uncharacterized protein n=1 Tax=Armillaria luteobubalina TaxID=153913 RepID=A0AA39P158_9AGAR|nr:hypothetical protein EDD18DRAFT_194519 [Armillaria luteobubalina]